METVASFVRQQLARAADPRRAFTMAAYMKTSPPFYGVMRPRLAALCKEARRKFAASSQASNEQNVLALWNLPHREEQYAAIEYAKQERYITAVSLPLYEKMIREARGGIWWTISRST
ncbi:MAG TPA: DNA alkylation repair protein [Bryobacteraceae bacterium]|nr:DNA alkylation repair protein [Bryobacteraceae bacterium]